MQRTRLTIGILFALLLAASSTTSAAARSQTVPQRVTRLVHQSLSDLNRERRQLVVLHKLTQPLVAACRVAKHLPAKARAAAQTALKRTAAPLQDRVGKVLARLVDDEADLDELDNLIDGLTGGDKTKARHVHHALREGKGDLVVAQDNLHDALKKVPALNCGDAGSKLTAFEKNESSAERWLEDAKQLASLL